MKLLISFLLVFISSSFSQVRYKDFIFTDASLLVVNSQQYETNISDQFSPPSFSMFLDIIKPPASDPVLRRPLVIWVHGGNFSGGGRSDFTPYCREFARRGYVTATIDYRLMRSGGLGGGNYNIDSTVKGAERDVYRALAYLKANSATHRIDTNMVLIGGWSAGSSTSWRSGYDYEYMGLTLPAFKGTAPIDAENIKLTDFVVGDPPWIWIQHDTTVSASDEDPRPYAHVADSLGIPRLYTFIPGSDHVALNQNAAFIVQECVLIATFWANNVPGLTVTVNPCSGE